MKIDIVNKLFDDLSARSTTYITIIGIVLTAFSILMVVFGYQKHKFSDNGIKKMEEELVKRFFLKNDSMKKAYKD